MTPFTISSAGESDVPILLAMIRELAEFERLVHELEVTADSLRAALFGERPVAAALLARVDGFPAGYAVYYHTFSTFVGRPGIYLDDIYVRPEFRKRGIGRALLEAVAKIGMELGGGRFDWIALRWNENAVQFYRSLGAKVMDEWALLRMNSREVKTSSPRKCRWPRETCLAWGAQPPRLPFGAPSRRTFFARMETAVCECEPKSQRRGRR